MRNLILLLLLSSNCFAQKDTVIKNDVYESTFSFHYKNPKMVKYKLYHGGGECSRATLRFKSECKGTACAKDYAASGYDEGHLCNAEDFSSDCVKEEKTFRFYNCLPQTANMNRGIWKHYETEIRKLSQHDSLLIICGGIFVDSTMYQIGGTQVYVPKYCWKVVKSLSNCKVIYCLLFTNEVLGNTAKEIPLSLLQSMADVKIDIGATK